MCIRDSVSGWVHILADDVVYSYNTTSLSFSSSWTISDLNLARATGQTLIPWPSGGSRAPMDDTVLVGDGSGTHTMLRPNTLGHGWMGNSWDQLVFASGPSVTDMSDVVELNGILYISGFHELEGDSIERYNIAQSRWQSALDLPVTTTGTLCLATDGTDLFVGTEDAGVLQMSINGSLIQSWDTSVDLSANEVIDIELDVLTGQMIAIHPFSGMSVIDTNSTTVNETWTTNSGGLATNQMNSLAVRGGIAYLGTNNRGVERLSLIHI